MDYGLIGARLGHSYSVPIHEAVGGYAYELKELPTEEDVRRFFAARAFRAINVTIPYKRLALALCDEVEPRAAAIGAVNTVVNHGGQLIGSNTDFAGFSWLARAHGVSLAGRSVMILGTGGTHDTVEAVCREAGAAEIATVSRSGKNGTLTYDEAQRWRQVQVIVNTTPAGMFPENGTCLLQPDKASFPALEAVLDVVYNPFRTELLLRAAEAGPQGVVTACGFEMLVAQAVYASEHFLGCARTDEVRDEVIRKTHRELRRKMENISLIGMPGCGKSSIGRALAARLGKTFVDLDAEAEKAAGCSIPVLFAQQGEEEFRRLESQLVRQFSKKNGQVLACGGGVIKTLGNARALHQNGEVLWVQRPVEALAMNGRPLSTGRQRLAAMEAERRTLYQNAADAVVSNTGTREDAVRLAELAFAQCLAEKT